MKQRYLTLMVLLLWALAKPSFSQIDTEFRFECPTDGRIAVKGSEASVNISCEEDKIMEVLFRTSIVGIPLGLLVTDTDNKIISVSYHTILDLGDLPEGTYRIWGFFYLGEAFAKPGLNAKTDKLASICYALTQNFITVNNSSVSAGVLSFLDGTTKKYTCLAESNLIDTFSYTTTSTSTQYIYAVTDEQNKIMGFLGGTTFDFEDAPKGVYRIWGVSYFGNLLARPGDIITGVPLTNKCFDLSDNYLEVIRDNAEGGTISLTNGLDYLLSCSGAAGPIFASLQKQSSSLVKYTYLLINPQNNIQEIILGNEYDIFGLPAGNYQIWGVSYTGDISAAIGQPFNGAVITNDCFDLSDNFISVSIGRVDPAFITTTADETNLLICANDNKPNLYEFKAEGGRGEGFVYLLTDTDNKILKILDTSSFDFETALLGDCRIWGLSYNGTLLAAPGVNAGSARLSDGCFVLSVNFIHALKISPNAGLVSLSDNATNGKACLGDGKPDVFSFITNTQDTGLYAYLITDENNRILALPERPSADFEGATPGICRVWGVSYLGNITAEIGDILDSTDIADSCYDLSDNFITIDRTLVDGGTVSLANGATSSLVCGGDGIPDIREFTFVSAADTSYTFLITDPGNKLLAVLTGNTIDFDVAPAGNCRVWGVSYTGNLVVETNQDITEENLSTECFALSSNFIAIQREIAIGGTVQFTNGDTRALICPEDNRPDVLSFSSSDAVSTGGFVYLVTDTSNTIISVLSEGSYDFDASSVGTCRIWGLAFTGSLLAQPGLDADTAPLSTGCFSPSTNFVEVIKEKPEAGMVSGLDGESLFYICPGDERPNVIDFTNAGAMASQYAYIITDEANDILMVAAGNSQDFNDAPAGTCRVWGVAFTGALTVDTAGNISTAVLSDDCFDVSDNFIEIVKEVPEAGVISIPSGVSSLFVCIGDGKPDIIRLDSLLASNTPYLYVLTDESNTVIEILQSDRKNFDDAAEGINRLWGLSYTGSLLVEVGSTLVNTALSDDCYDLSSNFIELTLSGPRAGNISLPDKTNQLDLCIGDSTPDTVNFLVEGASALPYLFLITDEEGFLLGVIEDNFFDFNRTVDGKIRIYGLSYNGVLSVLPGDNIFNVVRLATDCYDLTEQFIALNLYKVDGGTIGTIGLTNGLSTIYTCAGDRQNDFVPFFHTSSANNAKYNFILTDAENKIVGLINGNQYDFERAGSAVNHVWGVSYNGVLTANLGDVITEVPLTDSCYALSSNFIKVVHTDNIDGGTVTSNGSKSITACVDGEDGHVTFATSSSSIAGYLYVVTDTLDNILDYSDSSSFNFASLNPGDYRVYGLSYTGILGFQTGDKIKEAPLTTSCYDLSDDFVMVKRLQTVDGALINSQFDADTINVCGMDAVSDIVILSNNSTAGQPITSYRYIITDENNRILIPSVQSEIIDFNPAPEGISKIWGVSYTGNLTTQFGQDITVTSLSNQCFSLSKNFIVVNIKSPQAGRVTTAAGDTTVAVVVNNPGTDVIRFSATGQSANAQYQFIITNEAGLITALPAADSFDFSGSQTGIARVYGMAYYGELILSIGDNVLTQPLATECYNLSANFIEVNKTNSSNDDSGDGQNLRAQAGMLSNLKAYPNPNAQETITLSFEKWEGSITQSTCRIVNMTGQTVLLDNLDIVEGKNNFVLNINTLADGVYIIYLECGFLTQQIRFVRTQTH